MLLGLVMFSCQKDTEVLPETKPLADEIAQAQQWFDSEVLLSGRPGNQQTLETTERASGKYNYWKGGLTYSLDGDRIVEVPLGEEVKKSYLLGEGTSDDAAQSTLRKLIVTLHGNGQTDYALMTIVAHPAYLAQGNKLEDNHYKNMDGDFTGMVLYHSWNERFMGGWQYTDGKITGKVNGMAAVGTVGGKQVELVQVGCEYIDVAQYCTVCSGTIDENGDYHEQGCVTKSCGTTSIRVCTEDGGGGGSYPPLLPPGGGGSGDYGTGGGGNGSGSGGGGSTGGGGSYGEILTKIIGQFQYPADSDYETKYPRLTETIKNLKALVLENPKVLQALMQLTGLTEAEIANHMKYGQGPIIKIVEYDDSFGQVYGRFNAKKYGSNTITINSAFVNGLEQAYYPGTIKATAFLLAVTILHEYVHFGTNYNDVDEGEYDLGYNLESYAFKAFINKTNAGDYYMDFVKYLPDANN